MTLLLPTGRGIYVRALPDSYLARYDWIAVTSSRSDSASDVRAARERGQGAWLFDDPARYTPSRALGTLESEIARARSLGATGVIADLEDAWPSATEAQAIAIGEAIARAPVPVGITTYPSMRWRALWGRLTRGRAWIGPQLYPPAPAITGDYPLSRLTEWHREYSAMWGGAIVPHVRLWRGPTRPPAPGACDARPRPPGCDWSRWVQSPDVYAEYLAAIPISGASAAWPIGVPPEWMTDLYLDRSILPAALVAGGLGLSALVMIVLGAVLLYLATRPS